MNSIIEFIKTRFSGYTVSLFIISSLLLAFSDRRQLKQSDLKREAGFSMVFGIIYAVIGLFSFIIIIM